MVAQINAEMFVTKILCQEWKNTSGINENRFTSLEIFRALQKVDQISILLLNFLELSLSNVKDFKHEI